MTAPTVTLETDITRDRPASQQEGSIQVGQDELDDSVITLSFGGPWGTTYADLTPEEAQAIATALEDTANRAQQEENADE
ncbi:hypothetical protein J2751_002682 [Halorubrum alkaliphilum]|uniref:Uncharacterized protein n=1 Tax=Halorubrum alkaliphilum TaxID=261290 RepID=A0A8T4GIW9_9EURY|nr:hypothetical protein [Halorubrum alkaliphilum]MBP1923637.1 hypothetical protein [Halorubrum alkaliphilum]